ncbi:hypothetical protein P3X46_022076 [Hevea brasiliensis]|uniref:Uncharacterized protein n=1 Tax=Hevea brasiliensis TaxID=3981 RepID=A0ABQ9LHI6_HEVBR|nr:uncharacterized protein LOC110655987 [Hevea brasiliensis]KAJ9167422.1 hypothetical protein P3X46_022076 [Hevea brasiliensis]
MAYRRKQHTATTKPSISTSYDEEVEDDDTTNSSYSSTSLAAKAIRASSAAHRDSSLSSAYGFKQPPLSSSFSSSSSFPASNVTSTSTSTSTASFSSSKDSKPHEYISMRNLNESKQGFWGNLARKAKSILEDDNAPQQVDSPRRAPQHVPHASTKPKYQNPYPYHDSQRKTESPTLQKGLNAISSSLNYVGNAVEEGLTKVENRTADIIQETRKHIRKKPGGAGTQNQANSRGSTWQQPQIQTQNQTDQELQLKASRDVAMAMAAKAKLLLRELKTVKADLAFAKERCAQLEEENKILRENRERGDNPEDDDLIRLQLETLLSEKARLAHENSIYARENRFLREVVEYHQLTMQDVVYLDEGTEEVTEVYPIKVVSNTHSVPLSLQPSLPTEVLLDSSLRTSRDIAPRPVPPPGLLENTQSVTPPSSNATAVDTKKHTSPSV